MRSHHVETEIKLELRDAATGRALLRAAGFRISKRRVREFNTVFDTQGGELRKAESLLRLRTAGKDGVLTFKGPPVESRHKSREETETAVDAGACARILEAIGFKPVFRYEKYRTEYREGRSGVAMLDETPIGVYLELEGSPAWIDRMARQMGFGERDYITASYARLFTERGRNAAKPDMLFESAGQKQK